jgi:hypothetical protein
VEKTLAVFQRWCFNVARTNYAKGERKMYTHIDWIAREALGKWGQTAVALYLEKGEIEIAEKYALGEVDVRYGFGDISFETAATAYNLLCLSPERAARFPQRNGENGE